MNRLPVVLWIALTVLALFFFFHGAFPARHQPIMAAQTAYRTLPLPVTCTRTNKTYQHDLLAFNRRTIITAYQQYGRQSAAWNERAKTVLDAYLRATCDALPPSDTGRLATEAKAAIDQGCDDPLILYIYGKALSDRDKAAAIPYLQCATEAFAGSKYPKVRARLAPLRLAQCLAETKQTNGLAETETLALQWTADALTDGSVHAGEEPIFLELYFKFADFYTPHVPELLAMLHAKKLEESYSYQVLAGRNEMNQAWKARGGGYANTVTAQGWKDFYAHLRQAETYLTKAWKAHPEYPQAPTLMIAVAMGNEDAGPTRRWFDRAVAAQFDYMDAYSSYEWSIYPRWGGSLDEMHLFGEECYLSKRYDTQVPLFYLRTLQDVERDGNTEEFWAFTGTYDKLKAMFAGYEKVNDPAEIANERSLHAATAYRYQDFMTAKEQLKILGDQVVPTAFPDFAKAKQDIADHTR